MHRERNKSHISISKRNKIATREWILEKEETENKEVKWENINREI